MWPAEPASTAMNRGVLDKSSIALIVLRSIVPDMQRASFTTTPDDVPAR